MAASRLISNRLSGFHRLDVRSGLGGLGGAIAALAVAGAAQAGCNTCTTPTPAPTTSTCNCVPSGHNVTVPGVNITPPTVTIGASGVAYASATATASASAEAYSSVLASSSASASGTIYNGGGGSNWYVEQGASGVIPNLQVEGVEGGEARRICTELRSTQTVVAIQAVCLDDKSVPHPASQVLPDRDVAGGYDGEVYRCIAGARMQYTVGRFAGVANFDHGQTITCDKNQALYHSASGQLACRVQKPARDCNERSLLRRYGAGIKVLKLASANVCAAYRSEVATGPSAAGSMVLDGGVGGVVH